MKNTMTVFGLLILSHLGYNISPSHWSITIVIELYVCTGHPTIVFLRSATMLCYSGYNISPSKGVPPFAVIQICVLTQNT